MRAQVEPSGRQKSTEARLRGLARRILRKARGWDMASEKYDEERFPHEHVRELDWLVTLLRKEFHGEQHSR